MSRTLVLAAPVLTLALVATSTGQPPAQRPREQPAQQRVDHPRLRAALHELREARRGLAAAPDSWPPGYKERATQSLGSAINTLRTLLAVKDVDNFRGVERKSDYYTRYRDNPRLRAALDDVRDGRDELRAAKADFGDLKDQALDDLDVAAGDIVTLIRSSRR